MKDLDINNFVDSILSGKPTPKSPKTVSEGVIDNYDIENIELPDSFVEYIIEGKQSTSNLNKEIKKEIEVIRNTPIVKEKAIVESNNDKVQRLMKELQDLVSKAKTVIQEMTTCGMIGTTTAAPNLFPKKKKKEIVLQDKRKWKSRN